MREEGGGDMRDDGGGDMRTDGGTRRDDAGAGWERCTDA